MFTDTHCHLYDQAFSDRKSEVQLAAIAAGVTTILLPNISAASLPLLDGVDASFPELKTYGMVGLHPCYVKEDWESELDMIRSHYLKNPEKYCAVGEIGMDLYWDTTTQDIQIQALETQLDWAVEWDLPIVLHVRSSFKQLLPVLEAAQLADVLLAAAVDQGVEVDPANSGGVWSQLRLCLGGQCWGDLTEVFEHSAASPVEIC